MSFPQTRHTLVQRLASGGSPEDWGQFLKDYWGPICRFSLRFGARNLDDAEDLASQTFEVLWEKQLLVRWISNRAAKLRTLLCCVVRNLLSSRGRIQAGRDRLAQEVAEHLQRLGQASDSDEQVDVFYAAWVEDVVQRAVESLAAEYHGQGRGNYVRVLYGRLCEGLSIAQVAAALEIKPTDVSNYFRHARDRLSEKLQQLVHEQVARYCAAAEDVDAELALEWGQLGQYLADHGGLEEAVRRTYEALNPVQAKKSRAAGLGKAVTRLSTIVREPPGAGTSSETS